MGHILVKRFCPYCGLKQSFKFTKKEYAALTIFLRLQCLRCEGIFDTGKSDKDTELR